jgi:ABC-type phosphate/phosphonate transport system substrate-binding protein
VKDVTLLFATFLASANYKMYHYVTEYVERFTGIPTLLLNGEDLDDFSAGYIDAGFIATSDYAYLSNQLPNPIERIAQPVAQGVLVQSERDDCGVSRFRVVVRRESPYCELNDLQQGTFSYCFRGHFSAEEVPMYQSLEQTLLACNASQQPVSIKETVETSSHIQALRLVLNGQVDAAVVEERVLNLMLRNSTGLLDGVRILGAERVAKMSDVVVVTHLDAQVKQGLREAFRTIHQEAFFAQYLREGSIEQFLVAEQKQLALPVNSQNGTKARVDEQEQAYAFYW